jgi:hypothetical protein
LPAVLQLSSPQLSSRSVQFVPLIAAQSTKYLHEIPFLAILILVFVFLYLSIRLSSTAFLGVGCLRPRVARLGLLVRIRIPNRIRCPLSIPFYISNHHQKKTLLPAFERKPPP